MTDKNFKFSKSSKMVMGYIKDKAARLAYKKAMIDAENSNEINKKKSAKSATKDFKEVVKD